MLAGAFFAHLHDHFIPNHRNHYHPHILGHRALGLFSAFLVTVKIFTIALISVGPAIPAFSSAITSENIISLTNFSRQQYQLSPLSHNSVLTRAAQAKANDMMARGYFSHNTPDGKTPWSFLAAANYNYLTAGENLAVNFTESEAVSEAWMNSPGHKANILNKNFEEIGIGIAQGEYQGHSAIIVVQMFGAPAEQNVHLTDTPTQVQTADVPQPVPAAVRVAEAQPVQTGGQQAKTNVLAPAKKLAMPSKAPVQQTTTPADQTLPETPITFEAAKIIDASVQVNVTEAMLSVETNASASKVIVFYGSGAVMLTPKDSTHWYALLDLGKAAAANGSVSVVTEDMQGRKDTKILAEFASSTTQNYNVLGVSAQAKSALMGRIFDPRSAEQKFYLFFVAALLSSLVLAIAIKRHVQHLSLVANASFVVILAVILYAA